MRLATHWSPRYLAVQFFLIPLAVVGIAVTVYVGFRSLLADNRGAQNTSPRCATVDPIAGGRRRMSFRG
jgi:hypothetical protein